MNSNNGRADHGSISEVIVNQYTIYTVNLINVNYFRKLKRKKERTKEKEKKTTNQLNVFAAININRGDIIIKDKVS